VRSLVELRLDRGCRRWITRTLEGPNPGAEIWTHAFPVSEERLEIVVDFFVPGVAPADREKVGRAFARLYERLYDEDVAMMVERQRQLDRRVAPYSASGQELVLGPRRELSLPLECELEGRRYVVAEAAGDLVLYPALCPHQLGPLGHGSLEGGVVRCPWHGYAFDVRTGRCVSGQPHRLPPCPTVAERDDEVVVVRPLPR
jgi:nitrite reductase/ring-hydroxylating ferredoxin subunit